MSPHSGEGNGTPLQYSCLENPMDWGAWWAAVPGVAKSRTQLRDFTFTFHFHVLEKEMATHSSVLAWRIPGMGEPGGLPSMGSHRVRHNWTDLAAAVPPLTFSLSCHTEYFFAFTLSSSALYPLPAVKEKKTHKNNNKSWVRTRKTYGVRKFSQIPMFSCVIFDNSSNLPMSSSFLC